jgi:glycosyltransferase involved in cell wall biosynthesis
VHVVPNPIAIGHHPPADVAANSEFIAVGRLSRDKGPALFAEAARKAQVSAVFVGAGDEETAIRQANPDAEISGWLEPARVQARIRAARAVVSSSLWYEVQPLATLEAAAHGVPAIVPDNTAFTELVPNGVTGLWFRGGDVDDLGDKLKRLAEDDELTQTLGRSAADRFWRGAWDVDTHVDRLEAVYAHLL